MTESSGTNPFKQLSQFVPPMALRSVTSRDGLGVYASSDTLYKGAVFGRDSLEVAEDLLDTNRALTRRILLTLGSLQGELDNPTNEEEPGRIVHEYRQRKVDGKPLRGEQLTIYERLASAWGEENGSIAYYGSIDATPMFVRAVGRYVHRYGERLLQEKVTLLRSYGSELPVTLSMRIIVENALSWLNTALNRSESGLLEFKRRNDAGDFNPNQAWKDSRESYVHTSGELANHSGPIASIEVQGLVYDAFQTAASLFPQKSEYYLHRAQELRDRTIELMWQPDQQYFALGTDYDNAGKLRTIRTRMANAAALLDSYFFYDLPEEARKQYVSGIVRTIMSHDFLTDAGIRSRAISESELIPFWDYHGSFVSWPKETYDIAKGLRRQGFPALARQLENRLLNVCLRNLAYPEFVFVDETGVVLPVRPTKREHAGLVIDAPNRPEVVQAWTVSAIVAIIKQRTRAKLLGPASRSLQAPWQRQLETELFAASRYMDRHFNPVTLRNSYPTRDFKLKKSA